MKTRDLTLAILCSSIVFAFAAFSAPETDNSKMNKRDIKANSMTSDKQKVNSADTNITAKIRQDILKIKELSQYGQNVKIITVDRKVTLKGPVRTLAEQEQILASAKAVAGPENVVDLMSVEPIKTK